MSTVLVVVISTVVTMIVAELVDIGAWISPRIVRLAARRLPQADLRQRYEEEWLAELKCYDGLKLVKLFKAFGIWIGSFRVARAYQDGVSVLSYTTRLVRLLPGVLRVAWGGVGYKMERGGNSIKMPGAIVITLAFQSLLLTWDQQISLKLNTKSVVTTATIEGEVVANRFLIVFDHQIVQRLCVLLHILWELRSGTSVRDVWRKRAKTTRTVTTLKE